MMRMRNLFAAMVLAMIAAVVAVAPAAAYASLEAADFENGPTSNDELFAAYVDQQFELACDELTGEYSLETMAVKSVRDKLDSLGKSIYDILVPKVNDVASGKQHETTFTIMASDLSYSSANDVFEAIKSATNALMEDYPYEFYWYDKTMGMSYGFNGRAFTVSYIVSSDYSASGATGTTTTRSDLSKVKAAANNAAAVVAKHKGDNDPVKLDAYRSEICDRVAYNDNAAQGGYGHYGDPWQLIWVFDGDASTTVVCEGYAKAFKYLCDLSTFKNSSIACYTVNGVMQSNAGAVDHMWNIVVVDGKSYLADVTNCDTGAVGSALLANGSAPGKYLFMKGYSSVITGGYRIDIPKKEASTGSGKTWVDPTSVSYIYGNDASPTLGASVLKLSDKDWTISVKTKKFVVAKVKNKKYTGKAIKPKPVVKYQGVKLKSGTDYTLAYKNNKKVGTAKIVIKGKGWFSGKKTATFKIVKA